MSQFTEKVVKYFRPKKQEGTSQFGDITYFGAEERFVSALRNSNLNNLEEQLIIGTDTYAIEGEDDEGNKTERKYFCPLENDKGIKEANQYYKLYTVYYKDGISKHYYFDDNGTLHFSNYFEEADFNNNQLVLNNTHNTFSFGTNGVLQIIPDTIDAKLEKLYFHHHPKDSSEQIEPVDPNDPNRDPSGDEDADYNRIIITKESAYMNKKGDQQNNAFREKIINHLKTSN